jgi:hypothetical protein
MQSIISKDNKSRSTVKNKKLEAAAALQLDFKRLNIDERLSVMIQYSLITKAIEIRTKREEQDMMMEHEADSLGSGYGLEKRGQDTKMNPFMTKNEKRYAELLGMYLV